MDEVLPWLDEHAAAISATSTVVLAIVTLAYVLITNRIAGANRDLVRATEQMASATSAGYLLQVAPIITGMGMGFSGTVGGAGDQIIVWLNSGQGSAFELELRGEVRFDDGTRISLETQRVQIAHGGKQFQTTHPVSGEITTRLAKDWEHQTLRYEARYHDSLGTVYESRQEGAQRPRITRVEAEGNT